METRIFSMIVARLNLSMCYDVLMVTIWTAQVFLSARKRDEGSASGS